MSTPSATIDIAPPGTPEMLEFEKKVKRFVEDNFQTLKDAHYGKNTVRYHSCCNTFSTKKSKSKKGHGSSQTLSKFLGKTQEHVTQQLMVKRCQQVSRELSGSRRMSIPTLNQPHQDHSALDKRLAEAEAEAAQAQAQPGTKLNSLQLKVAMLKHQKAALEQKLKEEEAKTQTATNENLMFGFFLRYNGIDPHKVLSGWSPEGEWGDEIRLRWPTFYLDQDGNQRLYQ